jgi:Na+-translocating ferredoxin:NAD+ oxidoreductase RnfD subunit
MSAAEAVIAPPRAPERPRIDPRWLSSSLLTLILVGLEVSRRSITSDVRPWMLALTVALGAEIVLHWLHTGRSVNLLSAYISGNSVIILLKPEKSLLWPYVTCAALAILSKYVLRYRGRHLWNPTNFSVCAMLLLAPHQVSILSHQWGNDLWIVGVIWCVGLLVVIRARVWHLTIGYLVLFVVLAWVRTLFNHQALAAELGPVTGPMYQLFMFFMVTDPRTIVSGRRNQLVVLVLVALAECAIRMAVDFGALPGDSALAVAPGMFALFIVGPAALYWQLRRQAEPKPPAAVSRRSASAASTATSVSAR